MGKGYKGKVCAYCSTAIADTEDHIFSRQFFLPRHRANLPKAPACRNSNNQKSKLEHYVSTVLPFGGRHADAQEALITLVPPRLAKNLKVKNKLALGKSTTWFRSAKHLFFQGGTVSFSSETMLELFSLIARGLIWYHWKKYVGQNAIVDPVFPLRRDLQHIDKLFKLKPADAAVNNIGSGSAVYRGSLVDSNRCLSVWQFQMFGGVILTGDPRLPNEIPSSIVVFVTEKEFVDLSRWKSGYGVNYPSRVSGTRA